MSAQASHLVAIGSAAIPDYPLSASARLDGQSFVKWNSSRYLASSLFLEAGYEVQGVARALFDLCQTQTPVGTLPDSDLQLSRLLHLDLAAWVDLRSRALGPLHNWHPCMCGAERRLMHPVVLEVVEDALLRRQQHELSKEDRAEGARLDRLVKGLREIGCSDAVTDDFVLMNRMNDWLKAQCKGRRTQTVYRTALRHAISQRWCDQIPNLL